LGEPIERHQSVRYLGSLPGITDGNGKVWLVLLQGIMIGHRFGTISRPTVSQPPTG